MILAAKLQDLDQCYSGIVRKQSPGEKKVMEGSFEAFVTDLVIFIPNVVSKPK